MTLRTLLLCLRRCPHLSVKHKAELVNSCAAKARKGFFFFLMFSFGGCHHKYVHFLKPGKADGTLGSQGQDPIDLGRSSKALALNQFSASCSMKRATVSLRPRIQLWARFSRDSSEEQWDLLAEENLNVSSTWFIQ